jgi:tRNA-dihydrouridine synthase
VSVKLRALDKKEGSESSIIDFVNQLRDAGASWVTLHPRTAAQKRRGQADWSQIQELKSKVNFPIIGNGDIQTVDDVVNMRNETNCDMVMAGRALAAKPWMLWQYGEKLGFGPPAGKFGFAPKGPAEEGQEYGKSLLRLLYFMKIYFQEDLAIKKFRFHVRTTSVWLSFGHELYSKTTKAQNFEQMELSLKEFFEYENLMSERTELRQ